VNGQPHAAAVLSPGTEGRRLDGVVKSLFPGDKTAEA